MDGHQKDPNILYTFKKIVPTNFSVGLKFGQAGGQKKFEIQPLPRGDFFQKLVPNLKIIGVFLRPNFKTIFFILFSFGPI